MAGAAAYDVERAYPLEGGGSAPVAAVRQQLDRLLRSQYFRNSRRYPRLLEYVVEETLAGRAEQLKERTLGIAVFGRPGDYDSNADPVVRVTAGEVRKRLAQYYQQHAGDGELRIELALGSYVARFAPAHETLMQEPLHRETAPREASSLEMQPAELPETEPGTVAFTADAALVEPAAHIASAEPPREMPDVPLLATPAVADAPPTSATQPAKARWTPLRWLQAHRMLLLWGALTAVLAAAAALVGYRWPHAAPLPEAATTELWQPMLSPAPGPVEIVLGVHSLDTAGKDLPAIIGGTEGNRPNMLAAMLRNDMVPVSDVSALSGLTELMTRAGHTYRIDSSSQTSLRQLRGAPVLLVGGLDNAWTLRLTAPLRFHFYATDMDASSIVDAEHPGTAWRFDNMQSVHGASKDYAIVASFADTTIGEPVVVIAGIGMAGTTAAAEFATHAPELAAALRDANGTGHHRNVEFVIGTEILNDEPGPPHVIASTVW